MQSRFEWVPAKAASNLSKHRIDFLDAITVFDDSLRLEKDVTKPEHGEARTMAIGMMYDGKMVAVIYTWRNSKRRIISARKVRKNEQQAYDQRKASG